MTRLEKETKRKKRVTLNKRNSTSVMILNDGEMGDALTSQPQAASTPDIPPQNHNPLLLLIFLLLLFLLILLLLHLL